MAFGSGSSLATDRWMRRRGVPSPLQAFRAGKATLLHQHSSKKPMAQVSGSALATSISRSRLLFSFVQWVGGGDPPLGPHPPHRKEARQSGPDGLPRDALCRKTLLEGDIGGHL